MSAIGRRLAYVEGRIAPQDGGRLPVRVLLVEPRETHEAAAARQKVDLHDTSVRLLIVQFVQSGDGNALAAVSN